MAERITLLGGSGYVGSYMSMILPREYNHSVYAPPTAEVNLLNGYFNIKKWIESNNPNVVINFAADTRVDGADIETSQDVNIVGAAKAALAAKEAGKHFIHISTDMVFPGTVDYPGPYDEDAETPEALYSQLGIYAQSKLLGEKAVAELGGSLSIVRISFPFGNPNSPKDYAIKLVKAVKAGYPMFTDQKITPTYLPDLALALSVIAEERRQGIFHVASSSIGSPYSFASYLMKVLGLPYEVKEGSIHDFVNKPGIAPRPVWGGLNTFQTRKRTAVGLMDYRDAIDDYLPELEKGLKSQGII